MELKLIKTIMKGGNMDNEKLKQLLAGIGIAGLVAGVSLTAPGQAHGSSG
jgi:radical SAM modification target selenobiotic family peptide